VILKIEKEIHAVDLWLSAMACEAQQLFLLPRIRKALEILAHCNMQAG